MRDHVNKFKFEIYAKNLDMPINFTSSVRKSYILGDHFKAYLDEFA